MKCVFLHSLKTKCSIGTPSCHCGTIWQQKNSWSELKALVMTHLLKLQQPRGLSYHHGIKISYTYQWQSHCQQGYLECCLRIPCLLLQSKEMCQQPLRTTEVYGKWQWGYSQLNTQTATHRHIDLWKLGLHLLTQSTMNLCVRGSRTAEG